MPNNRRNRRKVNFEDQRKADSAARSEGSEARDDGDQPVVQEEQQQQEPVAQTPPHDAASPKQTAAPAAEVAAAPVTPEQRPAPAAEPVAPESTPAKDATPRKQQSPKASPQKPRTAAAAPTTEQDAPTPPVERTAPAKPAEPAAASPKAEKAPEQAPAKAVEQQPADKAPEKPREKAAEQPAEKPVVAKPAVQEPSKAQPPVAADAQQPKAEKAASEQTAAPKPKPKRDLFSHFTNAKPVVPTVLDDPRVQNGTISEPEMRALLQQQQQQQRAPAPPAPAATSSPSKHATDPAPVTTQSLRSQEAHAGPTPARDGADLARTLTPMVKYAGYFAAARYALQYALRRYGPEEFTRASSDRQTRTILYIFSIVNALRCIAYHLGELPYNVLRSGSLLPYRFEALKDMSPPGADGRKKPAVPRRVEAWLQTAPSGICTTNAYTRAVGRMERARDLLAFVDGYLLHDFVTLGPKGWAQYPADFLHHVFGLIIGNSCDVNAIHSYPFVGTVLFAESSSLFLNLMWLVREYPKASTRVLEATKLASVVRWVHGAAADPLQVVAKKVLPKLFVAQFAYTRVLMMPLMLLMLSLTKVPDAYLTRDEKRQGGSVSLLHRALGRLGKYVYVFIVLLQLYWFRKIVAMVKA